MIIDLIKKRPLFYLFLILTVLTSFVVILLFFRHTLKLFESFCIPWSEDQAQFNQVIWNLVNNGNLANSIFSSGCFFSGKFNLILFFLAPLYFFRQDITTLFFITIVFLASTGIILYLISYHLTKNSFVSFVLALLFYLYIPVINLSTIGFRGTIIAMPLFALGLFFYLRKQFWPMMFSLALAAFCREDVPLILIGFSFMAFLEKRDLHWKLYPGLFGFLYFYIIFSYIMPWFRAVPMPEGPLFMPGVAMLPSGGGANFGTYGHLGGSPFEIVKNFFLRFNVVVDVLRREHVSLFLNNLLRPNFFLGVLSPFSYIPFSQYMVMFLSDRTYFASTGTYYFAPVVPFLFVGIADALRRIREFVDRRRVINGTWVMIILVLLMFWQSKDNLNRLWNRWTPSPRLARVEHIFKQIPQESRVTAQIILLQFLSSRDNLYIFADYPETEYVVLDFHGNIWPLPRDDYENKVKRLLVAGDYGVVDSSGVLVLFRRGASMEQNPEVFARLFRLKDKKEFDEIRYKYNMKVKYYERQKKNGLNLLCNEGFEEVFNDGPKGWEIYFWQQDAKKCVYTVDSEVKKSGTYSLKIKQEAVADSRWGQEVKVKPDTYYELSGWIKTEDVENLGDGAHLEISGSGAKSKKVNGTSDWEKVSAVGKTGKEQRVVTVLCRLGGNAAPNIGTAYFDDIQLRETVSLNEIP